MATRARAVQLDGLRAFAVALVFLHHTDMPRFPGGFFGVDVFFVLSGYLITSLLLREQASSGKIWYGGFYARRALRLVPALVVLTVVCVVVGLALHIGRPIADGGFAVLYLSDIYVIVTSGIGGLFAHTWSLSVEEQFYLVWPVLLMTGIRRQWRLLRVVAISTLAIVVFVIAVDLAGSAHYGEQLWLRKLYRSPLTHVPELACGVFLALLLRDGVPAQLRRVVRSALVPAGVVALLLAATLTIHEKSQWLYFGGFLLSGILVALLVAHLVIEEDSPAIRALSLAPVVWLGQRSYAFYLWHYPALDVLGRYIHQPLGLGVVGLVITLVLTEASWRLVELPFLRKKVRFEPQSQPLAAIP